MTPDVATVYIHGVGMWPPSFAPVAARVPGAHLLWVRPGYDRRPSVAAFDDQVRALRSDLKALAPVRVVGVSGGATLALALAIDGVEGVVAIVTHEPLVGPLEPTLHARVAAAGERLRRAPGPQAADTFVRGLYGRRSWEHLPTDGRRWAGDHHRTICREVSHFSTFAPTVAQLAAVSVPHVTTVGRWSGPERHRVADLLRDNGAAKVQLDTGHLVHVDDPIAFAGVVAATPCGGDR